MKWWKGEQEEEENTRQKLEQTAQIFEVEWINIKKGGKGWGIEGRNDEKEIKELNTTINFYKKEIKKDKNTITELQDSLQLEKFAREKYLMKKENEDIYIIEFDTLRR